MSEADTLAEALLDPAAWPHEVDDLRIIETHISRVYLTGDYAYKIKKPVQLDFLDYSTLEQRRRSAEDELRLNMRWAPELYIDVVPITGRPDAPSVSGGGTPIEYAVRMRQFPQAALLSVQLDQGLLTQEDVLDLAAMIADRHASAPANDEVRLGGHAAIRKPMDENYPYIAAWLGPDEVDVFRRWTDRELARHERLLEARRRDGRIRRCHGDLHLRNLVRLEDGIVAFDCIEFSEELRTLDVISDLTFLSMDLVAGGHEALAWTLLDRYLALSGDYEGMQLYGLYHVYHCMIRAKVAAIRASERSDDESAGRETDLADMHHYLDVARNWIEREGAALIVMHGLSGSGKTWVSSRLVGTLGAVRLRSDTERKRLHGLAENAATGSAPGEGLYGKAASAAVYTRLNALAKCLLSNGHRVVLDATFLRRHERDAARTLAAQLGVPSVIVAVEAPETELVPRLEARQDTGGDASEADREVLAFQRRRVEDVDDREEQPVVHYVNEPGASTAALTARIESVLADV